MRPERRKRPRVGMVFFIEDAVPRLCEQLCFPFYAITRELQARYRPLLEPLGLAHRLHLGLELDLEQAGVRYQKTGVEVDDQLRTSNPRISAAGDVIGQAQFTHAADHHARLVLRNALFPVPGGRVSTLVIPRVTYTQPEVAAVGIPAIEASKDPTLRVYTVAVGDTDRARTEGETEGYAKVIVDKKGHIRGASIVAEDAGDLLAPLTLAITHKLTMGQLASTIVPYPTRGEVVSRLASAWNCG